MRTWKILLVVGLAVLAIGLVAASAFASVVRPVATPYGTYNGVNGPNGGGYYGGGMMGGYGYSPYGGYSNGANGYGRCMGW